MSVPCAIETLSGRMFDYDTPRAEDVCVGDVARALSNLCRFVGHTTRYYSVAEHAVNCHDLVQRAGFPREVCLAALHHDSHEAYLGDVATPLKRKIKRVAPGMWEALEAEVDAVVVSALCLDPEAMQHDAIECADSLMLSYEAAVLKPSGKAQRHGAWVQVDPEEVPTWMRFGLSPEKARDVFLDRHCAQS